MSADRLAATAAEHALTWEGVLTHNGYGPVAACRQGCRHGARVDAAAVTVILQGIVGSTAYGLAREGSDKDRLGVFVAPTVEVAGLDWKPRDESSVTTNPDVALHELRKYLALALQCNPTITELLWLDSRFNDYEILSAEGVELVDLRRAFLSEQAVRSAYGGYGRQQAGKLRDRGDSFSSDTKKRKAKHGRHLLRLLRQGRQLLETGRLDVRIADPTDYFAFDHYTTEQMLAVYEREDALFTSARSVLPAVPDRERVRRFLAEVRIAHCAAL